MPSDLDADPAEVHHVDLGLGYEPSDWPEDYVAVAGPGRDRA